MVTWRAEVAYAMSKNGDTEVDIVSSVPLWDDPEWDREFDNGYGGTNGCPFTIWTVNKVYFPVSYDGSEWVSFVSRNPDGIPTTHRGGG